jgi:fluoride exporter
VKATIAALGIPTLVFVGGGLGAVVRYWIGGLVQHFWGSAFPAGTMVVNVSGCVAAGFLAAVLPGPAVLRDDVRALLFVGFLGGYTTFSTFGREAIALAMAAQWGRLGVYVVLTNVLGLGGVWLGVMAGRWGSGILR